MKLFLLFILFSTGLFAQEHVSYSTKNGLPSNHVYDMAQDTAGNMWFSTNRGMVKFDGNDFRVFNLKDGLPNNDIFKIKADRKGKIWFSTKSKYLGYILNDSVYKFLAEDSLALSQSVVHQTKDSIWYGHYRLKGNTFIKDREYEVQNESNLLLKKQFKAKSSAVIPGINKHILLFEDSLTLFGKKNDSEFSVKYNAPDLFFDHPVKFELLPNSICFFAFRKGILFLDFERKQVKIYPIDDLIKPLSFRNTHITALINEIQICIPDTILKFGYDMELKEIIKVHYTENTIKSFQDQSDNIWTTSLSKGIKFYRASELKANYYLLNEKTSKVAFVNSQLIVGVEEKGFYFFNKKTNIFSKQGLKGNHRVIYDIETNRKESYLVSALSTYILKDNTLTDFVFDVKYSNEEFGKLSSFKNMTDFKGDYYFTTSSTLAKYNSKNKIGSVIAQKIGLHELAVFNNELFVGSTEGLMKLHQKKLLDLSKRHELLSLPILELYVMENYLVVGTNGRGIYFYNQNEIVPLPVTDGLMAQKIIESEDCLWLATESGVKKIRLNKKDLSQSYIEDAFYISDGLLQDNVNDLVLNDSFLYAASDIGVARLNINSQVYKKLPKLYFTDRTDTLSIYHSNGSHLSIEFGVLNFSNQDHFKYQYRLLPIQKNWASTSTRNLNFDGLSPGDYILEVNVKDQHNNQNVKRKYISIIPNWWQTNTAFIFFLLLILLLFIVFFKWFRNRIRKKERRKAEYDKKVAGLELQALRSQMNPHFVFNSLNAIQYYFQQNEVKLSEYYLVKFSKLVRLFFEYSRQQYISIKDEIELLEKYLSIEQLRFEEKLKFKIILDDDIDENEQVIPSMILQPIAENAVNHGLFHKENNGEIEIEFKLIGPQSFVVSIKDDGIGVLEANRIKTQSSKNYRSNSSTVLKERIKLLNQSKDWLIEYKIEDLTKLKNEPGTLVTLSFTQKTE